MPFSIWGSVTWKKSADYAVCQLEFLLHLMSLLTDLLNRHPPFDVFVSPLPPFSIVGISCVSVFLQAERSSDQVFSCHLSCAAVTHHQDLRTDQQMSTCFYRWGWVGDPAERNWGSSLEKHRFWEIQLGWQPGEMMSMWVVIWRWMIELQRDPSDCHSWERG